MRHQQGSDREEGAAGAHLRRSPERLAGVITVENVRGRTAPFGDAQVYVGRANARYGYVESALANPFVAKREADRVPAIGRYREWLAAKIAARDTAVTAELERLRQLAQSEAHLQLFCWCAPRACHAEVIAELVRAWPALARNA